MKVTRLKIQYLSHNEIDKQKWDQVIRSSFNGHLCAYSWYLDIVCEQWDALVEGDYQRVMPLPWKVVYRQNALYLPKYCCPLGIFSIDKIDAEIVEQFLSVIPRKFRITELWLNKFNKVQESHPDQEAIMVGEVDLIGEYPRLFESFTQKTQDTLTDLAQENFTIVRRIAIPEIIDFYLSFCIIETQNEREQMKERLQTILTALSKYGVGESIGINDSDNKLIAVAFFALHQNRAQLLIYESKNITASYLAVDEFIRSYSMKNITLEFPQPKSDEERILFEAFSSTHTKTVKISRRRVPFYIRPFISK